MNSVTISGRLVRDPEIRYTAGENPIPVANFTMAVERRFKKEGQPDADFPRVTMMGKSVESFVEKYVKQGSAVEVKGELRTGSYVNKNGDKVYTTEVFADAIGFAPRGSKNEQDGQPAQQNAPQAAQQSDVPAGFQNVKNDDVPF